MKLRKISGTFFLFLLAYLTVFSGIFTTASYSRFLIEGQNSDTARVASPKLIFIAGEPKINGFAPGETRRYEFRISNADETPSEVSLEYWFEFTFETADASELLFSYDLFYKPSLLAPEEHVGLREDSINVSKPIYIRHSESVTHTIILEINWNEKLYNTTDYANLSGVFNILTHVRQVN